VFIEATAAELRPIQKQIIGKKNKKIIFKKELKLSNDGGNNDIGTFVHICICVAVASYPN
jgi:hypothetical protein